MNEFINDAKIFFNLSIDKINLNMSNPDCINSIMNFALGLERLFKGLLYSINPIYIYTEDSFKKTAYLLYREKIIDNPPNFTEIDQNSKGDLLSFRESFNRSRYFSNFINTHSALFYRIGKFRDLIAHCELSKLNYEDIKAILNRDFAYAIKSISDELSLPILVEFDNPVKFDALYNLSLVIIEQEELVNKIETNFVAHRIIWEKKKDDADLLRKLNTKMHSFVGVLTASSYTEDFQCPCCMNQAIIRFESEPYIVENEIVGVDSILTELQCIYCDLHIQDYKELDHLKIEDEYWKTIANKTDITFLA
ncbi:MAG: hypothetical protein HYV28_05945 [Ignavibacteriales bacterium]|nr:hypothetical protein [Ignavibacteriales bacterium]